MRGKTIVLLVACLFVVSSLAIASNMGFKITIGLLTSTLGQNWFSLPYNVSFTNAGQLLTDVNTGGTRVSSVSRWNTATDAFQSWSGRAGTNFAITQGEAYMFAVTTAYDWVVVGSHNPAAAVSVAPGGSLNQVWVSVPYHTTATNAGTLFTEINTDTATCCASISRWNTSANGFETWSGRAGTNFAVTPGIAVMLAVTKAGTWTPAHY